MRPPPRPRAAAVADGTIVITARPAPRAARWALRVRPSMTSWPGKPQSAARSDGPTRTASTPFVAAISPAAAQARSVSIIATTRVSSPADRCSCAVTVPKRPALLYVAKPRSPSGG